MYDLIILGGGPAGYLSAERAAAQGLSVALVEKRALGGVCLNEGCIPSKTILHSAKLYSQARHSDEYGVHVKGAEFDLAKVMQRKETIVSTLRKGVASTLKKLKVTVFEGEGVIQPRRSEGLVVTVGDQEVTGRRLLICSGSEAIRPPIPGADQEWVYTNREVLQVTVLPKKFVVIGGGVIGLEIATFFAETGAEVTVIEMLPAIGGGLDKDVSTALQKALTRKGVRFELNARVSAIGDHTVTFEKEGETHTCAADTVLLSVGRRPVTSDIGLEHIHLHCERGAIVTDEHGRTNVPEVWAAGDVNGRSMLAHTAYREGEVCVNDMCGIRDRMRYMAVPGVVYTHPEVAMVGLTEDQARAQGREVAVGRLPLSFNGRYLAEVQGGRGFCKVVVDTRTQTIIGVHLIGSHCSEMIFGAAALIEQEITVEELKRIVFPHPTVSEIIKDTVWHMKR